MNIGKSILISTAIITVASALHANPWWENPVHVASTPTLDTNVDGPLSADVNGGYIALPSRMACGKGDNPGAFFLYRCSDALNGDLESPVYALTNSVVKSYYSDYQLRGASINTAQHRVLIGSYKGIYTLSLPLELEEDEQLVFDQPGAVNPNIFAITNDIGITIDFFHFSKDGRKLYCSAQSAPFRNNVYVFNVGHLNQSGCQLTSNKVISVGQRIRGSTYAIVNGREIYYALLDQKLGVKAVDLESGTVTTILPEQEDSASYGSIAVTGTAAHKPRLTILPEEDSNIIGTLKVFDLTQDGMHLASDTPVYTCLPGEINANLTQGTTGYNGTTLDISDDESTAYIGRHCKLHLVCFKPVIRVINVGEKATVRVNDEGLPVMPGSTISGRVNHIHRLYVPHVYVDGKEAPLDQQGYFSGTAGATADVVITYVYKYAWYYDPTFKNKLSVNTTTYSPWGGFLDEKNGIYFGIVSCSYYGGGESGIVQIDAKTLIESRKDNQEAITWTASCYENGYETTRDISYSAEYGVVLASGMGSSTNTTVAYPVGQNWKPGPDDTRYCVTNDLNRRLWPAAFGHNSEYYYAIHDTAPELPTDQWVFPGPKSTNPVLAKFRCVDDGNGKLIGFEFVEDIVTDYLPQTSDYECLVGVVRTYYDAAHNRDIVYIAGRDGVTAVDTSTTPPTVVNNWFDNPGPWDETYPSLSIIGVDKGTPHMVLNRSTTGLSVFQLQSDLMTFASMTPVAKFKKQDAPFSTYGMNGNAMAFCGFGATEDEKYLFFNAPTDGINFSVLLLTSGHVLGCYPETFFIFR